MVLLVGGILFLCLRSPGAVVVALSEVLVVLIWTLGAMGYAGAPVTLVTAVLPVLLMTVSVTDEIHLLDRFRHHLAAARGGSISTGRAAARHAMESALRDVGEPIVLTSVTTSIAFISFITAVIDPVRHLGLFISLGVLLAMVLSFTFVPALVLLLPVSWLEEWRPRYRPVPAHERLVARRPDASAALVVVLVLISLPGLARLSIQDSWVDNLDPDSAPVLAERDLDSRFWGSYRFDVVLSTERPAFFRQPEGLRLIEEIVPVAEAGPHVGGALSHLLAFEAVAGALEERGRLSELPPERVSYLAYLLDRIRYRIGLDQLMPYSGCFARVRLFVRDADYGRTQELESYLERELEPVLADQDVSSSFSGDLPVAGAVVHAIATNMLRSVGWTVAGVALLLWISLRSLAAAAVAIAPLLAGAPMLLGAMGYAGIPIGVATSMFLAVTIGVAIDYALHFCHAYRRERCAGMGAEAALDATLACAGRAIRWNAGTLSLGMLVLMLSSLAPNRSLGLLLAAAMTTCYLTTLTLLPLLLSWLDAECRQGAVPGPPLG
jgi:predicted RND superfamily exporter protein